LFTVHTATKLDEAEHTNDEISSRSEAAGLQRPRQEKWESPLEGWLACPSDAARALLAVARTAQSTAMAPHQQRPHEQETGQCTQHTPKKDKNWLAGIQVDDDFRTKNLIGKWAAKCNRTQVH